MLRLEEFTSQGPKSKHVNTVGLQVFHYFDMMLYMRQHAVCKVTFAPETDILIFLVWTLVFKSM